MYRAYLLSLISGLLFVVSWPTYGFPIFLFFSFVPLLLIEDQFSIIKEIKNKAWKIFTLSFIAFFIWNFFTYFWLSKAHPQENPTQAELGQAWFAFGFASVVNTLLMSLAFLYYHKIRQRHGNFYGYLFFICAWFGLEKMHLNWDFAWPWLNLGNGFATYHQWIQWYEYTGSFGGTFWVLCVNILIFLSLHFFLNHQRRRFLVFGLVSVLAIAFPLLISLLIYQNYKEKGAEEYVGLIQPKLNPYTEKYNLPEAEIVGQMISLMEKEDLKPASILITPETSFPGKGSIDYDAIAQNLGVQMFEVFLSQNPQKVILAGVDMTKFHHQKNQPNERSIPLGNDAWANPSNAVLQIENGANEYPVYKKSKLVVGVELFPYSAFLKPLLGNVMLNFGGGVYSLTTQNSPEIFENSKNKAKIAPLVCYESIFGEFVSKFVKEGANLISVSTNDSWWGNSQGHRQLLAYAKLRAIENRRYVVRAANSGVSAIINQRGDIAHQLDYDSAGALAGKVKLNENNTYYSTFGDAIARVVLLFLGILLGYDLLYLIGKRLNHGKSK